MPLWCRIRAFRRELIVGSTSSFSIAIWIASGLVMPLRVVADPHAAFPADDPVPLEQIVVVATKYENSIRDVAADVTVLTREDLDATLAGSLEDTFRFVPGVSHEGGGSRFASEGVTIRGIGGNRVALEIDGVPISQHFAIGNFSNATRDFIDTGLIDRIEVLKGPASSLYGSDALGGVVVAQTPDAQRLVSAGTVGGDAGAVFHGRDDSLHWNARAAFVVDPVSVLVAASLRDGHLSEPAADMPAPDYRDYSRRAGLLKFAGGNRLDHRWQLTALKQTDEVATDIQSVLGDGRFRSTTLLQGDDRMAFELLAAEYDFGETAAWPAEGLIRVFHADADVSQHTVDERAAAADANLLLRRFSFDQRLRGAELNLWREETLGDWSHRLGLGLEWTERRTAELRDGTARSLHDGTVTSVILGENFPLRDFPITVTRETGAWLSDHLSNGPLTIMLGVRYDANRLSPRSDAVYRQDNPETEMVSVSASDISPKLGFVYHFGSDVDAYVQYAHGFRAPPFEDANIGLDIPLFNIRAIPNPDLRSETSDGWEAGLRWQTARTYLQVAAFHTQYDDFIESKARIGVDPQSGRLLFQSRNIDAARVRGVECRGSVDLGGVFSGIALHAAAYWAEGENSATGEALNSVGPPEAVIGLTWHSPDERTEIRTLVTAVNDRSGVDETAGPLIEPAGYAVLDIYFKQRLSERLTLRASVGNVTDRLYWHWADVRGLAPDAPMLAALARPGRNYSIGLEWGW